ncbi:MAG: UDP-3-O-(3-hydroxymyristoyl)glucosamine N-acyltransferase, partial [Campylobacter sp.]|nr:UDP-3-O-(3-hydroxymyristoyl)glucosamine N-acyltransferase [Campylobacter sp.]
IISSGTKIDNLVQVGHNCKLGQNCIIVSQSGLAGSTTLGKNVVMGGQSGTAGHLKIGDFTQCAAKTGITKSLESGKKYAGHPIYELKDWLKLHAKINRFFKNK